MGGLGCRVFRACENFGGASAWALLLDVRGDCTYPKLAPVLSCGGSDRIRGECLCFCLSCCLGSLAPVRTKSCTDVIPARADHYLPRFSIGTNALVSDPIHIWRGRAIFCSGSVNISCHCANQPMVRGMAKSTVNISGLNPIA